jgi:hypothetical protein
MQANQSWPDVSMFTSDSKSIDHMLSRLSLALQITPGRWLFVHASSHPEPKKVEGGLFKVPQMLWYTGDQ